MSGAVGRPTVATLPNGRHVDVIPIKAAAEQPLAGRDLLDDVLGGDGPVDAVSDYDAEAIVSAARQGGLVGATVRGILLTGAMGIAIGLFGALWSSRLLARFLYGVGPSDPATYGVVAALIVAVCLLASYTPARRITKLNPVEVLRAE